MRSEFIGGLSNLRNQTDIDGKHSKDFHVGQNGRRLSVVNLKDAF